MGSARIESRHFESSGPDFPLSHLLFGGLRLVEVLQNVRDSPYETQSFRKQATKVWNASIVRKNPKDKNSKERWALTLDESQHWLPVQLSPPNPKVLIKYGELDLDYALSVHTVPVTATFLMNVMRFTIGVNQHSRLRVVSSGLSSNSDEVLRCVAELLRFDPHAIHERKIKTA